MNYRVTLGFLAALAIIAAVVFGLDRFNIGPSPTANATATSVAGENLQMVRFDDSRVTALDMRQGEREVRAVKNGDTWIIAATNEPANRSTLSSLIIRMSQLRGTRRVGQSRGSRRVWPGAAPAGDRGSPGRWVAPRNRDRRQDAHPERPLRAKDRHRRRVRHRRPVRHRPRAVDRRSKRAASAHPAARGPPHRTLRHANPLDWGSSRPCLDRRTTEGRLGIVFA